MSTLLPSPRTTAALLVVGAVAEVVEQLLTPIDGSSTLRDLDAIAAHQGQFVLATMIGLVATVLYLPGLLGLGQACRRTSPRLAGTAGWLGAFSMAGFMAIRLGQALELSSVRIDGDRADMARSIDRAATNPIGATVLALFLLGALIGLSAFAVAGWRAGLSRTGCLLLAVFQPLDLVLPQHPFPLGIVSHVVLLAAFGLISARLVRTHDRSVDEVERAHAAAQRPSASPV